MGEEVAPGSPLAIPIAPLNEAGMLSSVVMLGQVPEVLWVESENAGPVPALTDLGLRRIGRFNALLRMFLALRTTSGANGLRLIAATLRDFVSVASYGGVRQATTLVVARYLHGLRATPAQESAKADLKLGWWWLGARRAELQPFNHLEPLAGGNEADSWEATGEDPRFKLADHAVAVSLKAGWYRLRVRMVTDSGGLVAPALYPDYGHGYAHEEMIRLPDPGPDGEIDVLILLKHDALNLRFDPTIRRARFMVRRFELTRLGRTSALARMLLGVGVGVGVGGVDWREMALAAVAFVRTAATHGMSTAAADLFARQPYQLQMQGGSYSDWVRRYDTIGKLDLAALAQRARALDDGPLISLLLPVYQTPEEWLRRCLDSVLRQVYGNWELCIADDASPDPRVREVLEEYASRDARIKLEFRPVNGHIAEASNTALALATGEFIGLLDHDDELRPHALLEMAEAISSRESLGLLYSDEDKIDAEGCRFSPYFKPDWNPDLLLSQNYVCHFTVISVDVVREAGGFRRGFEGSQDHDLFLRCTEKLPASRIHHVQRVLYHWRAIEGSTALARDAKDYAADAGARAVASHLDRRHPGARVEVLSHGHYRVHWPLPEPPPKVSLVIPSRDKVDLLRTCVDSILARTRYPAYEVVVVDNQSSDPAALEYLARIERDPRVRVLRYDAPFNYSAINNWAIGQCDGAVIGLLNNDIEVISPDWLAEMTSQAMRPGVGAVGAMLYYPNDTIQHAGVVLGVHGVAAHRYVGMPRGYPGHGGRARVAQQLSAVTGACLVVTREAYERVGKLDEALQVAFNDIDFCLRLEEAGYRNIWTPFAELYHHESASRGSEDTEEKRQRFAGEVDRMIQRWGSRLKNDPAYNPNLSLESLHSELAAPPRIRP
jgi:glycosyltransferase involved in cell wall biosynthesis